jgi:DNA polymerase-3 subunit delta'
MELLLNERTANQLSAAINMAGGCLFYGRAGMGKATVAHDWTRRLNCAVGGCTVAAAACDHCRRINAGVYPDLVVLQPDEKGIIGVAAARELTALLSTKPYFADSVRMVIVDQAQTMTTPAQNALLKLLEEPPPRTRFILVATALESLLITVRSRLSAVYFAPVAVSELAAWLEEHLGQSAAAAAHLAALAMGAPGAAIRLAGDTEATASLERLTELTHSLSSAGLFDGLRSARQLVEEKADLGQLTQRLQEKVKLALQQGIIESNLASSRLAALERLRQGLADGLNRRVALELLTLEMHHV